MRTTIRIDDDLHEVVQSLARHNRRSLSDTVAVLLRRGLRAESGVERDTAMGRDPDTGFPRIRSERPVTIHDVRSLEDEP